MITTFRDRSEAGRLLAAQLAQYAGRPDVLVLALPRGGVPVAFEIARALGAPLDVMVVRKLGVPGREELAMGAIAAGGVRALNEEIIRSMGISDAVVGEVTAREQRELGRRMSAYRGRASAPDLAGKTVILTDDGIATGFTMRAAISAARAQQPARLIVAVPVLPESTARSMAAEGVEVIALTVPEVFFAVGNFYDAFDQTSDEEVRAFLGWRGGGPA